MNPALDDFRALARGRPAPDAPEETPLQAARAIIDGCAFLTSHAVRGAHHDPQVPQPTAGTLRSIAQHLSLSHLLAARQIRHLATEAALAGHDTWEGQRAAGRLHVAAAAWRLCADQWQDVVTSPEAGPRDPAARTVETVTIRIGRLLFTAPGWTPVDGGSRPLRPAAALLADPATAAAVLASVHALPAAAGAIADQHAHTAGQLAASGALHSNARAHRPDGAPAWYPVQQGQLGKITAAYTAAKGASADATRATAAAAQAAGHPITRAAQLPAPVAGQRSGHPHPLAPSDVMSASRA
jgi:hypothetical protein